MRCDGCSLHDELRIREVHLSGTLRAKQAYGDDRVRVVEWRCCAARDDGDREDSERWSRDESDWVEFGEQSFLVSTVNVQSIYRHHSSSLQSVHCSSLAG